MTLAPLINAPLLIQFHMFWALLAVLLGPVAIHRKRRDRLHKIVGYVWVISMFMVATSALGIPAQSDPQLPTHGPECPARWLQP